MANLKERLAKQREALKRSGPGKFLTIKEGVTRIRILPVGEERDFAQEAVYFFLGLKDKMAEISPATLGLKCALLKGQEKLAQSKDPEDRKYANKFKPTKRFLIPVITYSDEKGKEVNEEVGRKLMLIPSGVYQELIDLYLDEDAGDFTDPKRGYDIKIKRTGKGKMDTEYTVLRGNPSALPKKYQKEVDLDEMIKGILPTYEETKHLLEEVLSLPPEEEEEAEDKPKKKKTTKTSKSGKKKKRDL